MGDAGVFNEERKKWMQFDEDTEVLLRFAPRNELIAIRQKSERTAGRTGANVDEISNEAIFRDKVCPELQYRIHGICIGKF